MKGSRIQSFLRISLLVVAVMLVFDSGILSPVTTQIADTTYTYVAAVGASMSARVEGNEYNTLSAQIAQEQQRLNDREQALNDREIAARTYDPQSHSEYSTYILSILLFIILVLLVLNYVMDWKRARMYGVYEKRTS